MDAAQPKYRGIFSSDWSECLSPNGPFDPISYNYPELKSDLESIFRQYTGNVITLREAVSRIRHMLPNLLTIEQMDAYLNAEFATYRGVAELMDWCARNNVLFMLNTTGTQGYFQRAIAKGLFPPVPIIAANPFISYPSVEDGDRYSLTIGEIDDKPVNTESAIKQYGLSPQNTVIMGDSGGDGPHFRWASGAGAFAVASMAKLSLVNFCGKNNVKINEFFGVKYAPGQSRDIDAEMKFNFLNVSEIIQKAIDL
jgi:2-hydroxy-3-keto-5-methylthiopentenyl-1-phosphate phosphatase